MDSSATRTQPSFNLNHPSTIHNPQFLDHGSIIANGDNPRGQKRVQVPYTLVGSPGKRLKHEVATTANLYYDTLSELAPAKSDIATIPTSSYASAHATDGSIVAGMASAPYPVANGPDYGTPYTGQTGDYTAYNPPMPAAAGSILDSVFPSSNAEPYFYVHAQTQALPYHNAPTLPQYTLLDSSSSLPGGGNGMQGSSQEGEAFTLDSSTSMRIQSLPALDNLASQVLVTFASSSFQDIMTFVTEPDTGQGQAYATLQALFEHTRKLYNREQPFLNARDLHLEQPEYAAIIGKANLATFISSLFGRHDISFSNLNHCFLETFVPMGHKLLKWQSAIYLELKTQAYIFALLNSSKPWQEVLNELFPGNLESCILARRPGSKQLSPVEQEFINRANGRRQHLMVESSSPDASNTLVEKYDWTEFLKEVSHAISKNLDDTNTMMDRSYPGSQALMNLSTHVTSGQTLQPRLAPAQHWQIPQQSQTQALDPRHDVSASEAVIDVPPAMHGGDQSSSDSQQFLQNYSGVPQTDQPPYYGTLDVRSPTNNDSNQQSQDAPTQVLYEKARQATIAKAPPTTRRPPVPSQRRPWSADEERALMDGLDRVKGPHWSQILALYGAGGSISEVLKDRNQVQLKDKARNLKLFFLKSGIDVPYYLQGVTGELKTRAPAQAAKRAKEDAMGNRNAVVSDRAKMEAARLLGTGKSPSLGTLAGV